MYYTLNQPVDVLAYYFTGGGHDTRCFPKRISVNDRELDFVESGLRCLVRKGQSIIQIFNMSDGRDLYRLAFEPEQKSWTLLTRKSL